MLFFSPLATKLDPAGLEGRVSCVERRATSRGNAQRVEGVSKSAQAVVEEVTARAVVMVVTAGGMAGDTMGGLVVTVGEGVVGRKT